MERRKRVVEPLKKGQWVQRGSDQACGVVIKVFPRRISKLFGLVRVRFRDIVYASDAYIEVDDLEPANTSPCSLLRREIS